MSYFCSTRLFWPNFIYELNILTLLFHVLTEKREAQLHKHKALYSSINSYSREIATQDNSLSPLTVLRTAIQLHQKQPREGSAAAANGFQKRSKIDPYLLQPEMHPPALSTRLLAVPFWIVERAREIAERKTGARRKKREETGGEAGRKGTAVLAVTDAFEFPVAPATENSDWSINNSCCRQV